MNFAALSNSHSRARHGLTLVEAMLSAMIVSIVLVSTLSLVGGVARTGRSFSERALASDVADGLIAEILGKSYSSSASPLNFGLESGETSSSKVPYDDVDDYNGWTQSYAFTGRASSTDNLVASVSVMYVSPSAVNTNAGSDQGLKRVCVTVQRQSRVLAERYAWKSDAK